MPAAKRRAVNRAVLDWYRRAHRDLPWRHTRDPYAILVSEVMLQQTQVERVLPKYLDWMARYPTLS
ncbi:MAG TPA: A/G-specific adenine glycosylase, partial [Chloroflexota bacterium]|nr:A/G-specific adenine glycosylase [Chloroflexota bacterium]